MVKLSIIIPVYNVAPYVEKCLRSCAEQDISPKDYEIIVINDGTKDNSLEIVERVAKNYPNITIHSQENQGLSAARNKGVELSNGDYIWFVDSDDWIENNSVRIVLDEIENTKKDIIAISYAHYYESGDFESFIHGNDYNNNIEYLNSSNFQVGAVFYIYNKRIFNEFQFTPNLLHEDEEFTNRVIYKYENIAFLKNILYIANQREGSITRSFDPERAFDLLIVCDSLYSFTEKEVSNEFKYIFKNRISLLFNNSLYISLQMNDDEQEKLLDEILKRGYLFNCLKQSTVSKYIIEGYVMSFFPKKTITLYKMFRKFKY